MAILLAFVLGLIVGLVLKGINIHIVHKSVDNVDKPKEYNQSLAPFFREFSRLNIIEED